MYTGAYTGARHDPDRQSQPRFSMSPARMARKIFLLGIISYVESAQPLGGFKWRMFYIPLISRGLCNGIEYRISMLMKSVLDHYRIVSFIIYYQVNVIVRRALIYVTRKECWRDYLLLTERISKVARMHKVSHMAWHSLRILSYLTSQRNVINAVLMANVIHPFVMFFPPSLARQRKQGIKEIFQGMHVGAACYLHSSAIRVVFPGR